MDDNEPEFRVFDRDTLLMRDVPDDITPEEAMLLFGTEFDVSTQVLLALMEKMGATDEQITLINMQVREYCQQVFDLPQDVTVAEAMPQGRIIDLVTLGLLAHTILSRIDIRQVFPE